MRKDRNLSINFDISLRRMRNSKATGPAGAYPWDVGARAPGLKEMRK